jgi:hypothetical protein
MEGVPRPPSIIVDDEAPIRQDINSEDMNHTHPEVRRMKTATERNNHMKRCDECAYEALMNVDFRLDFRPPHVRRHEETSDKPFAKPL